MMRNGVILKALYIHTRNDPASQAMHTTLLKYGADEEPRSHEELPVNVVCGNIRRKLKVEGTSYCGRGRGLGAHRSVGQVEERVVVREEEVADVEDVSSNGSDTAPTIEFLYVQKINDERWPAVCSYTCTLV